MFYFLITFNFLILPLLSGWFYPDSFEYIKVISFISVTNVYFFITRIVHQSYNIFKWTVLDWLLIGFWLWLLIASLLNSSLTISIFGQYYRYQGIITLFCFLEFYYLIVISKYQISKVKALIFLSGILNCLFVIGQFLFNSASFYGRYTANLGNPNFTGGFLALCFGFSNILFFPLFLVAILLTGSRSALLALGVMMVIRLFGLIKNKKIASVFILAIVLGLVLVFPKREISSFDSRFEIWNKAIVAIGNKPVIGYGVENFDRAFTSVLGNLDFDLKNIRVDKAHNELLEYTVAGGILAGLLYGSIIIYSLLKIKENWLVATFVGYLIISSLNVMSVAEYLFFFLILAIIKQTSVDKFADNDRQE
ncbi:MAG TPA: O-antigen ligase family protein [Candidatus Woesebacteria bacterium]|nr:O-antigen ligase family protein [Candidatus Woesebacteria bacterium]